METVLTTELPLASVHVIYSVKCKEMVTGFVISVIVVMFITLLTSFIHIFEASGMFVIPNLPDCLIV